MKEINIPLPDFLEKQIAEIEVTINGKKRHYNYRIESFNWEPENELRDIEKKLERLQFEIKNYNKSWELIQIFKPKKDSKFVQVLFRQKEKTINRMA